MTAQVGTVFTGRDESLARTMKNIEGSALRLDRVLGNLRGRIRTAFEFHIVGRGIDLFERGVYRLLHLLPDLISRGNEWATTVDRIADITGMAAGEASELAAVAENVGVNADGLGRMMNALARSVSTNEEAFRDYGIRIKDSNGHLLSAYTIFQNVRQRISSMGPSLQAAKLSQLAFGRAALESADMLTLSNEQWERQARLARESGLILTEQGLAAAEEWERTQSRLHQAITGIGAQILQGVAPALIGLTNGVTRTINNNMGAIVRFGAGLVTFFANLAADLLGIQIDTTTLIGNAYADAAKDAETLRHRIDEQAKANDRSTASTHRNAAATSSARKEQQRLRDEIERAQRQLARERGRTTFTGGMNAVEIELFKQQRAAAIKAAQDRVADARKALTEHRATMAKLEGVSADAARRMRIPLQKTFGGGGQKGTIIEGLEGTLRDSKAFALSISDAIKDAIFGEDTQIQLGGGKPIEIRSGGLLDKLGSLATAIGGMGTHLENLNKLLDGNGPLVLGLAALAKILPISIPGLPGRGGGTGGTGGGAGMRGYGLRLLPLYGIGSQQDAFGPGEKPYQDDISQWVRQQIRGLLGWDRPPQPRKPSIIGGMPWLFPQPPMGPYLPYSNPGGVTNANQHPAWQPNWNNVPINIGFGLSSPFGITLASVFRTWMGSSSPIALGLDDVRQAVYGVQGALPTEWTPTGGTGGGNANLASRVGLLEARVDTQSRRNVDQDHKLTGLKNVNVAQGRALIDVRGVANAGVNKADKALTQNDGQRQLLAQHEARLDRLDGGGSGPHTRHVADTATSSRRSASNSDQMLNVLRDIRAELRRGGARGAGTSSLRAGA